MSDSLQRAVALHERSLELSEAGEFAEAEQPGREALMIAEQRLGPWHPDVALLLESLGSTLARLDRHEEAELCGRRAMEILERLGEQVSGPEPERLFVRALLLLGNSLQELGRFAEAEEPLQRALKRSFAFPGEPGLIANACNSLAMLYKRTDRLDDAANLYQRALKLCEAHAGEGHPSVAVLCHNLGGLEEAAGRPENAVYWFQRARQAAAGK